MPNGLGTPARAPNDRVCTNTLQNVAGKLNHYLDRGGPALNTVRPRRSYKQHDPCPSTRTLVRLRETNHIARQWLAAVRYWPKPGIAWDLDPEGHAFCSSCMRVYTNATVAHVFTAAAARLRHRHVTVHGSHAIAM